MSSQLTSNKRLAYLDAIKCLGILLVINGHVQLFGMGIKAYDSPSTLMLYSFNMPLFFFISGYLVYKEALVGKINEMRKIGNKFIFLVLPAFVFYCFLKITESDNILSCVKSGLEEYWFTISLFEMFVVYYLVNSISKSPKILITILSTLSVLGVCYLNFFSKYEIPLIDLNHLAKYLQFFTLGVFAKMFTASYDKLMKNEYLKALSVVSFFILLFAIYHIDLPSIIFHCFRDILLRYLGLYIVVSFFYCHQDIFNKDNLFNRLVLKIGQNSLAIYFLQYFFMPDLSSLLKLLGGLDWTSTYIISFVYTIIITSICFVFIEVLSNSIFVKKYILGKK